MIKKVVLFLALSFGFIFLNAQKVENLLNIESPIEFNGTEFYLSWAKQKSATLTLQEFLPSDEKAEEFSQLINFSYFNKDVKVDFAIREKIESLQQLEKKDKYAKVNDVADSPDGTEHIIDYMTSGITPDNKRFIEYNIQRFKKIEKGNAKALLIFGYIKRIYTDDLRFASKTISKQRDQLMTAVIEYKLPTITLDPPAKQN